MKPHHLIALVLVAALATVGFFVWSGEHEEYGLPGAGRVDQALVNSNDAEKTDNALSSPSKVNGRGNSESRQKQNASESGPVANVLCVTGSTTVATVLGIALLTDPRITFPNMLPSEDQLTQVPVACQ